MNDLKMMFAIILLFISLFPLMAMWIISILMGSIAKLLDNIVVSAGEWFNKTLNN